MSSPFEEQTLESAMNDFIDRNLGDKMLVDLENPVCRLVSSGSKQDSPSSDRSSRTVSLLQNIGEALKDGSEFAKCVSSEKKFKSLSSRSSLDPNNYNRGNEVLEHAEAVIEYQRERINILEKTVEKFNLAISKTSEMNKEELERYEKENREMRMQMQNVVSDYDAISKRYQVDMGEFESLKVKMLEADSELLKRDQQIRELNKKLEHLPKENDMLKIQKNELLEEVRSLKNELYPPVKSWQRKVYRAPTQLVPGQLTGPHVLCDVRKQETAAMGRCLMQVENDLLTFKRLSEEQRIEIERLNFLLQSKNKNEQFEGNPYFGSHKQLMYLRDVFVSMVKASNQLTESLKQKKQEPVEHEDRSLHAAYMLKSNSEQREMYDKLLEVVKNMISVKSSSTCFYRCKLDYCKLSELSEQDLQLKFNKMLVEVEDSLVLVHQLEDDQIIYTEMIRQNDLKAVRSDYKNLQFILKDQNYHVFKVENSDSYNRVYYALQYAGFVMDDSKLSIYSKVDLTYLNSEETWPQDLVPVMFSRVVNLNDQTGLRSPTNMLNAPNVVVLQPLTIGAHNQPLLNQTPNNQLVEYQINQFNQTMQKAIDNLFENVNVLSEFTASLVYYDQNSKSLVIYGPNLANKPKVLKPESTYKFTVKNNLEYSGNQPGQSEDGDEYVNSYQVPFATFPNGEPVLDHFNPQLTNYSLVSVKSNPPDGDVGNLVNKLGQVNLGQGNLSQTQPEGVLDTMKNQVNGNLLNSNAQALQGNLMAGNLPLDLLSTYEFDVYYVLPITPRYNDSLAKLLNKCQFLRLKATHQKDQPHDLKVEVDENDKFYTFVDGHLELNIGPTSDEPIRIPCSTGHYRVNEGSFEVTLMSNLDTDKMESFSLNVLNPQVYREFLLDLDKNGFTLIRGDLKSSTGQLCIVTKGFIQIFDTNEQSVPVPLAVFQPENTTVEVDEKMRSITITQKLDKILKMNLDCLSPTVFSKWKFALKFAGFLNTGEYDPKMDEMTTLNDFKFEIKIFDDDVDEKRAFKVTNDKIYLFSSPSSNNPLYVWDKLSINLELYQQNRRLRIYLKKHSKNEERFDLIIPLLSDYQNIASLLEKFNYKIDEPSTKFGLRYHYIMSKPGVISLYKTKYDKDPLISIGVKSYDAIVRTETFTIRFKPKTQSKSPIKLSFKKENTFKKFLLALKVSNFLPFSKDKIPILFFPSMVYGFVCAEAKQLFKDCRI